MCQMFSRYTLCEHLEDKRYLILHKLILNISTEQYRYFFFNRIVNMWNNLPESIISAKSETLPIFKRRLHKFDLHNIANLTY